MHPFVHTAWTRFKTQHADEDSEVPALSFGDEVTLDKTNILPLAEWGSTKNFAVLEKKCAEVKATAEEHLKHERLKRLHGLVVFPRDGIDLKSITTEEVSGDIKCSFIKVLTK
jgi:hypothetical protein